MTQQAAGFYNVNNLHEHSLIVYRPLKCILLFDPHNNVRWVKNAWYFSCWENRFRGFRTFSQGHPASKSQSCDSYPGFRTTSDTFHAMRGLSGAFPVRMFPAADCGCGRIQRCLWHRVFQGPVDSTLIGFLSGSVMHDFYISCLPKFMLASFQRHTAWHSEVAALKLCPTNANRSAERP